jgi:D-glycero-D-manno-heptose 1,7-bisphosphate phosphatase
MNPGALLDRDGTINVDEGYVAKPDDLEFKPGAVEAILTLNQRGYKVAVITNQGGVALGYHAEADIERFHIEMSRQLATFGAHIDRFYYCPHNVKGKIEPYNIECECRKPGDAMYRQAISDLDLDPTLCIAVGDKPTDLVPAIGLGVSSVLLVPRGHIDDPTPEEEQFQRAETLHSALDQLLT